MTLALLTPPALEPVTLVEVRRYLRLDATLEDELLTGLIKAARETLEQQTGLALISQKWRLYLDAWPKQGPVTIAKFPVRAIASVTAYRDDGKPVVLDAESLHLDRASRPAQLYPPSLQTGSVGGWEIDFDAGFGEAGADVPDALRHAIMTLVAHWYEFRGAYSATQQPVSYPPAFERVIGLWRRISL